MALLIICTWTYYRSINGGAFTNLAPNGSNDSNPVNQNYGFAMVYGASSRIHVPVAMPYLDSPNTTDSVEYKVYIRMNAGSGTVEFPEWWVSGSTNVSI